MSKSKMAVRTNNKSKSFQLNFDFGLADKSRKLLPLLLLCTLTAGLVYLSIKGRDLWNELLPIKQVVLQGNTEFVKHQDVVSFLQERSQSGLLAIDIDELQNQIKQLDWVKSAEIRKVWPEKLVFIIEEHQPVAIFNQMLLTQQGTVIKETNEQILQSKKIIDLPKISLSLELEKTTEQYEFIWKDFKQMKRELELVNLTLNHLNIDEMNNWHLDFISGLNFNLGRKNRLERVQRLVKVYKAIENKTEIKSIDLRYHNGFAVEWLEKNELNQQELKQKS